MSLDKYAQEIGKSTRDAGVSIGESLKGIKVSMIKSLEDSIKFYEEVIKYTKHSKKKQRNIKRLNSNRESLAYLKASNSCEQLVEKTSEYLNLLSEFAKNGATSQ